jgi:glutathione S-transferase
MTAPTPQPAFQLFYWPCSFRGCFISYLFAYRGVPLLETSDMVDIEQMKDVPPDEQDIPFMGPPVLRELDSGRALSQMPAIVLWAARELDLLPEDPFDVAMGMKVLMDCNDVLMEICRYNGSSMWTREEWKAFRSRRLPHWLQIFEASLARGAVGRRPVDFADIAVYALFGNMMRCLPALAPDVLTHAPGIHALCRELAAHPSLAAYVAEEEARYGDLYCGGQIEASIRQMLALDAGQ